MEFPIIRTFPHEGLAQFAVDLLKQSGINAYQVGGNLAFTEVANLPGGYIEVRVAEHQLSEAETILAEQNL
jgi:hypothetical protein